MKRRIFFFSLLLSALSIMLTLTLVYFAVYADFSNNIKREVQTSADSLKAAIESAGPAFLQSFETDAPGRRITLIASGGAVLYDSAEAPDASEDSLSLPEIQQAMHTGAGENTRNSATTGKQTYYYAVKLRDGSVLRISGATGSPFSSLGSLIPPMLLIALAALTVAAILSSRMARGIVAPFGKLRLDIPEENAVYEELSPLFAHTRAQDETIARLRAQLRQNQIEFNSITSRMREGFLIIDKDARVLSYNKSALKLLDARRAQTDNQSVLTFNRSEAFRSATETALAGEPASRILTIAGKHCEMLATPVFSGKMVRGAVIVLLDVTEREERERLRRDFTANVSHELKTPLTSISGYAEIIANGVAKPADVPRFARSIYEEAQRLMTLIGDIMTLSRLDENDPALPRGPVDLYEVSQDAAAHIGGAAGDRGIAVGLTGEETIVYGFRSVLEEMIRNLCDNALKYNHEGGRIDIAVERLENGTARLTVTDTGRGIPKEEQPRVFERFYRVDRSREAVEGTGLGLSIVKHGAILHGAALELASEEDVGTTVTLTFPAVEDGATTGGGTDPVKKP